MSTITGFFQFDSEAGHHHISRKPAQASTSAQNRCTRHWYLYKTCRLTNPQIHKWIREKWGGNPWRVQYSPGVCPEGTCPVVRSHPDSLCVGSKLHQERTYELRDFWNLSRPFCHTAWKLTSQHTFQNSVLLDTWGLHLAFCLEASNDFDGVASTFCTK